MPKHYLIPYVPLKGHKDPDFKELAYGHSGQRGKVLKDNLSKGSFLFFHTKIGSNKYITCYIVVDRILSGKEARTDPLISCDGKYDDWLFIGDINKSKRLRKPIPFNKHLAKKLSLNIGFEASDSQGKLNLQCLGQQQGLIGNLLKTIFLFCFRKLKNMKKTPNLKTLKMFNITLIFMMKVKR